VPRQSSLAAHLNAHPVTGWQLAIAASALVALVIDGVDIQLLALVSPVILAEWGVDKASFGPALAAALVGMSFGASLGGWLGDRFGRKRVLVAAMVMFGMATMCAGFTGSIVQMTVLRLVSGLGFGAAAPNGIALASEWLPERARPRVAALLSVGTPLGGMLGAMTVLQVLPALGWKGCFLVCGGVTVLLGLVLLAVLPESPGFLIAKSRLTEARRAVRRIAGVEAELVVREPDRAVAPGAATIFTPDNRRVNFGSSLAFFSISFIAYAIITWTPVLLTSSGFQLPEALRATIAFNFAAVVAALLVSLLIRRVGTRWLLLGCSCGSLICILVVGAMLTGQSGEPAEMAKLIVTIAIGASGGFTGAGLAAIYAVLTLAYSTECRASGIGFGMMMGRIGAITTVVSGGYLLNLSPGAPIPFVSVLAAGAALAVAGTLIVDRHVVRATD
jgi:MFS transporter, AAHS family, 4-hydroxybenzoate transporter